MKKFNMLDGPPIDIETANMIYEIYSEIYGKGQSLNDIKSRGGFGWSEVSLLVKEYKRIFGNDKYKNLIAKYDEKRFGNETKFFDEEKIKNIELPKPTQDQIDYLKKLNAVNLINDRALKIISDSLSKDKTDFSGFSILIQDRMFYKLTRLLETSSNDYKHNYEFIEPKDIDIGDIFIVHDITKDAWVHDRKPYIANAKGIQKSMFGDVIHAKYAHNQEIITKFLK